MVSFGQILLIIFLAILLFGDLPNIIRKFSSFIKQVPKRSREDIKNKGK
jgi:Sec-independent protein translocase protein TatA